MKTITVVTIALFGIFILNLSAFGQCVSLNTMGVAYNQDFNTLAITGTSSTLPTGWFLSESRMNADTSYATGTGSSNTGDTYSFGITSSGERALGTLQSANLLSSIGACFTNNTGNTIAGLYIEYIGEQWRLGTADRTDRLDFAYSTNATSLTTGTWTNVSALNFVTPNTAGPVGEKDGSSPSFQTPVNSSIIGLSIANGTTFWIRWTDFDASGADDGLAIDEFGLVPKAVPTSAGINVGGRVMTKNGQGIPRALIVLTDSQGNSRSVMTNSFGYYNFEEIESGQTVSLTVTHKQFIFIQPSLAINVGENVTDADFISADVH